MTTPIRARKAGSLRPAEVSTLLERLGSPESVAILQMQQVEGRDLQCLLDIHWSAVDAGHDTLSAWWRKDLIGCHRGIYDADRTQSKRRTL